MIWKNVQYYLFWLQLKAVFLNLVYLHLDEHFRAHRLIIKYWRSNIKNYKMSIADNSTEDCHFHFHAQWLILHIRTTIARIVALVGLWFVF